MSNFLFFLTITAPVFGVCMSNDHILLIKWYQINSSLDEFSSRVLCRDELGKNINADEAAAMGAVYQAAALSKAFKVKPFLIRDAALFPIQVSVSSVWCWIKLGGTFITFMPSFLLYSIRSEKFPSTSLLRWNSAERLRKRRVRR